MPLVKSPRMTPAKLAANRANARKGTGPRTPQGKRRVMLNALKHGRYARTEKLIEGGADSGLLEWIRAQIVACYQPQGERGRRTTEQLTREVYCSFMPGPGERREAGKRGKLPTRSSLWAMQWVKWREGGLETEPRYAVKSVDSRVTSPFPLRVRLRVRGEARELVFWVRRRRQTMGFMLETLLGRVQEAVEARGERDETPEERAEVARWWAEWSELAAAVRETARAAGAALGRLWGRGNVSPSGWAATTPWPPPEPGGEWEAREPT